MKHKNLASIALIGSMALTALCSGQAIAQTAAPAADPAAADMATPAGFSTHKEALSYAIGVSTARNLIKDGIDIDPAIVLKGMQDALAGERTQMSEKDIKAMMNGLISEMRKNMAANRHDLEEMNKKKGEEFRDKFAKQDNVTKLPNGVLYKVEKMGTGPKPTIEDSIIVKYRGTLITGKEFDGTPEGKSTTLKVDKLITGWRETIRLMPTGSRWTIVIPSALAYGQRGVGAEIGPNETLIFDVDLIKITQAVVD
jgi:FKBP-type peptidyl-prolyl cis-trans isomerase FklB